MVTGAGTGLQVMEQAGMVHMVEGDTKVFLLCIILILICKLLVFQILFSPKTVLKKSIELSFQSFLLFGRRKRESVMERSLSLTYTILATFLCMFCVRVVKFVGWESICLIQMCLLTSSIIILLLTSITRSCESSSLTFKETT